MPSNIIAFPANGGLPAHLAQRKSSFAAFYQGVGASFAVLSIKGKVFTLVRGGERQIIPDPADPDEPARALNLVLLAANPTLSKVYYAKGYEDGSTDKPTCYSNDGTKPAADATEPQSKTCAGCKWNVFGSSSNGRGKACQDSRRLAVAPAGQLDDVMLLRVPPASLKPLAEYAIDLERRGVPLEGTVTKVRFDPEEATPRLVFKPEGLLDADAYNTALRMIDSDTVRTILGVAPNAPSAATPPVVNEAEVAQAMNKAETKSKAKPEPSPEPKAAAPATPEPKASEGDPLASALDEALSGAFDDDDSVA